MAPPFDGTERRLTQSASTRGRTVTGTPESAALPETSSTRGVGEVVDRDAGQRRRVAEPDAVGRRGRSRAAG